MAVNARTFQLLYIVRQRAVEDLPTRQEDFAEFIADRRKHAPSIYSKAYISPSALTEMLQRMTVEGLLSLSYSQDREYELTVQGSQMADLLTDIDACSTRFIDNFKEEVAIAALRQRHRLGQGPATPRDVAAVSGMSLDSARRGLQTLEARGLVVEDREGRTPSYSLKDPPPVAAKPTATEGRDFTTDDTDFGVPTPGGLDDTPKAADDDVRAMLADIDDDDVSPGSGVPFERGSTDDDADDFSVPLGRILGDEEDDEDDEVEEPTNVVNLDDHREPEDDPYDWNSVSEEVRAGHILRARAAGVSLEDYFGVLNTVHERKVREALFEGEDGVIVPGPALLDLMKKFRDGE